jgi:hypothetical protein
VLALTLANSKRFPSRDALTAFGRSACGGFCANRRALVGGNGAWAQAIDPDIGQDAPRGALRASKREQFRAVPHQ